ncbi:AraC family transcriptional regulator [Jeotgalibacillus proteolyticus]|uniref:AraC family transcriptional regulator n=2 Tax=Jeotgalibacillus proteolyticus TaxID=2082395 RepID=A0A2S5G982_9BACL|nr:AraC family transcriptional regulator [Jeotgalibacillus proteolyticus]
MKPKVIEKESFRVAGYQFEANLQEIMGSDLVSRTVARLGEEADLFQNKLGNHLYLVQVYPMKEAFDAAKDPFTTMVGYEVTGEEAPDGAILHTVEKNTYVAYTHKGPESDLPHSYDYLYGTWLRENGYMSLGYDFELWDERYKPEERDNEIDLFIAVRKL